MRILLDTHVWLWLQVSPERISAAHLELLQDASTERFLSVASAWEIAIKFAIGTLPLPEPPRAVRSQTPRNRRSRISSRRSFDRVAPIATAATVAVGVVMTELDLVQPPSRGPWAALTLALWAVLGIGCATSRVHAPPSAPKATPSKTVLLVHGMFMTPACWAPWQSFFEAKGYSTLAPAWPGHDRAPAEARAAHPDPGLAAVDLAAVVDHYRKVIATLDEPPILVGHSMGGLVVQILLSEGLGSAAIAIDAAPPKGVFTLHPAFLRSNARVLRGDLDMPLDMDAERFAYVFVNAQPAQEQRAIWETFAQPESRRVGRDATTDAGKIDVLRPRGPLLLIAGEHDHAVPPVIGRKTFRRYTRADSYTEFREIAGADHWLIGGAKWREVAELSVQWLAKQGT